MNGSRFDALTRKGAGASAGRASRRALLKAGGIAGVASIAQRSGGGAVAQEATPPPARPTTRPPGGPSTAQLAFDLEYDAERLFAFVRDEVRYDPYAGVLRGAKGTLWGLAGNAADQAVLLAALLAEAMVVTRFVVGELDDAAAARLEEAGRWDEATVQEHAQKVLDFVNPGSEAVSLPEPPAEQREQAQELIDEGTRAVEAARGQIGATVQLLQDALDAQGIQIAPLSASLPQRERTQHIWLQRQSGSEWIDLDPAFPDAESGTVYATKSQVLDELPDDTFHTVTLRVIAEVVSGGEAVEQELLTYGKRAADLAGEALTFVHMSRENLKALGFTVSGGLEGTAQFIPNVFGPGEGEAGLPMTFGAGQGIFDLGDTTEGEAIAEWLEIEVAPVDRPVRNERRTIFDRVGSEQRRAGTVDVSALPPVELTDFGDGETGYMPLTAVTRIAVSGSEVPGSFFVQDYSVTDSLADLSGSLYGQLYTRSMLGLDRSPQIGARLFSDAPGVSMLTLAPRQITPDRAEGQLIFDLVHQGLSSQPTSQSTPASHPGMLGGVLDHIAERLILEGAQRAMGGEGPPPLSVGRLFEAALAGNVPIVTLSPGTTPDAELPISDRARAGIATALADGYVVVVPERAVDAGGESLSGWWQIDPVTGTAFDRLETGEGAAILLAPMGEGMITIYNGVHGVIAIRRMTLCTILVFYGVAAILVGAGLFGGAVSGGRGGLARAVVGAAIVRGPGGGAFGGGLACAV